VAGSASLSAREVIILLHDWDSLIPSTLLPGKELELRSYDNKYMGIKGKID
jgi:hypothetical protein